jgi:hypothetical protein
LGVAKMKSLEPGRMIRFFVTQPKQTVLARACESCFSYPTNCWIKGCILASGAVTGLLRMAFFVYYALFV